MSDPESAQWQPADLVVVAAPPDDLGGEESRILELWVEAVNALEMHGPAITTAPPQGTRGLVNLPVWFWTEEHEHRWPEELHAAAEAPELGERVDVYAEPLFMEWDMGDGNVRRCDGPGEAWQSGMDLLNPAHECHHTYRRTSRDEPGGVYEIVAITTWRVWWDINGSFDSELEIQVGTTGELQVDEIQVLTS
ncbi:hypothetical protein JQS43_22710 [Natronosporangium hydrolyticum]|uniref:Uncharacterized protein n=1 Tax=Natronosporangium hydrolyticum TaxID=2811111 RepID=A0A895YI89_9ACTN|nr:hypothetical protein [Natronosporangium hydrolyticum]QSB14286.1 hypothetical protein JQS43_22710 [Natronosporangium hydrolyticum]